MYKTRLAKWGLYKNNRELEMKAIFSKLTERAAAGKESSFELRGHKVDLRDCERYFKRKCFNIRDVISWKAAHTTTPSGLRCFTPEPEERLLAESFGSATWHPSQGCFSARADELEPGRVSGLLHGMAGGAAGRGGRGSGNR